MPKQYEVKVRRMFDQCFLSISEVERILLKEALSTNDNNVKNYLTDLAERISKLKY